MGLAIFKEIAGAFFSALFQGLTKLWPRKDAATTVIKEMHENEVEQNKPAGDWHDTTHGL